MKRTLFLSMIIFGLSASVNSQITLVQNDFPSAGVELTASRLSSMTIDYASTGANYQWDFSDLTLINQTGKDFFAPINLPFLVNFAYGPLASTAYRATYYSPYSDLPLNQISNYLPIQIADVNQYTRITTSRLNLLGYSASINGQAMPIKSDTIETKYELPLNFGDTYSSRGYTKLDLNPLADARWIQMRQRSSVVDGWGEITTPYGTFEVLRVKHEINEIDTVEYQGFTIGLNVPKTFEYEWLAKGEDIPILKVSTVQNSGVEVVTVVEFKDFDLLSANKISSEDEMLIFPNPVDKLVTIQSKEGVKAGKIFNVDGNLIKKFSFNDVAYQVDLSNLQAGMYFISIEKNGINTTQSFIKL